MYACFLEHLKNVIEENCRLLCLLFIDFEKAFRLCQEQHSEETNSYYQSKVRDGIRQDYILSLMLFPFVFDDDLHADLLGRREELQ